MSAQPTQNLSPSLAPADGPNWSPIDFKPLHLHFFAPKCEVTTASKFPLQRAGLDLSDLSLAVAAELNGVDRLSGLKAIFWKYLGFERTWGLISPRLLSASVSDFAAEARWFGTHRDVPVLFFRMRPGECTSKNLDKLLSMCSQRWGTCLVISADASVTRVRLEMVDDLEDRTCPKLRIFPCRDRFLLAARLAELRTYEANDVPCSAIDLLGRTRVLFESLREERVNPIEEEVLSPDELFRRDQHRFVRLNEEQQRVVFQRIQAMGPVLKTDGKKVRQVPQCCRLEYESLLWDLVLTHAGLCSAVIRSKKLGSKSHDQPDLEHYGLLGIRRAAELYDPNLGIKFSTYACHWIRHSIQMAIINLGHTIRFPAHLVSGPERIQNIPIILSLSHNEYGFSDRLPAPDLPAPLTLEARETRRNLSEEVEKWLRTLPSRNAVILRARFGFADGRKQTLAEIAEKYGVTRERVRQLQSRALQKLASYTRAKEFVEAEWWD